MALRFVFGKAKKGKRGRVWRLLLRVCGVGLVLGWLAFVFGVAFFSTIRFGQSTTEVKVPDLVGASRAVAESRLDTLDLVLEVVESRNDPRVPSGRVLEQVPPAGSAVRRGRKIKLILSLGGRVLEVPDLSGQAARAVAIELQRDGFAAGDEVRVPSHSVSTGRVIAHVPPAAATAVPSTRVHRLVSTGPPEAIWVMPDLVGLERRDAENWIAAGGFRKGQIRTVRRRGGLRGVVVGQSPLAGYPIRSKGVVDLAVSE